MAKKKRLLWLWILLVLALMGSLAMCCGCGGLVYFLPDMLVQAFTESGPLKAPVTDPDPTVGPRLERAFEQGGTVRVTGEELVQLVEPWEEDEIYAFWIDVREDDNIDFALSVYFPELDRYLNLQTTGAFEIEHGWFTDFTCDTIELSGWDWSEYLWGQQLAEHANRSMADQRSQNPDVAPFMDQIDHLWIEDGAINIELAPGGWDVWESMHGSGQASEW